MALSIRSMYPLALLEGQGMGTAYEYFSKLRILRAAFARAAAPGSIVAMGLPEKHGYDLDLVMLAYQLKCSLLVCEDRPEVLQAFHKALQELPEPAMRAHVQLGQVDSLTDWRPLASARFDWAISTASVQRLPDAEIVTYIQKAAHVADYACLFIPNGGNRAHAMLSNLRGLSLERCLSVCRQAVSTGVPGRWGESRSEATSHHPGETHLSRQGLPRVIAAGYCDIPPFPPGLARSLEAKEQAMRNPLETLAMHALEWWCRGEAVLPRPLKHKYAHLVYVVLDLREGTI